MKKRILWISSGLVLATILLIQICYLLVGFNASGRIYDKAEDVPAHEYGLLLGTSPLTPQGTHNFYFDNRIKAAVELYKAGKIKKILASGGDYWFDEDGNPTENGCNELRSMRDSLVKYGVPNEAISLDYDGTRTLNSIVKAKEVYGIDSCVIISQQYQNERAIYMADRYGLKAVGYNAAPSHNLKNRIKNKARELFARVKLFIDLLFGSKPSFDSYLIKTPNGQLQDWYDVPDTLSDIPGAVTHLSNTESSWGLYKCFSTRGKNHFYYNSRHGYYVLLPLDMGFNQSGENMMGMHSNEFYNVDTTLVISAYAMNYDAVLVDVPQYADSLRTSEKEFLIEMGPHRTQQISPNEWITRGRINHANEDNPPASQYIRKWLLNKDIDDRECEMSLTIYFNDSLQHRLPEFENIIRQFPRRPAILGGAPQ